MPLPYDPYADFTLQPLVDVGIRYLNGLAWTRRVRARGKKVVAGFLPPMELVLAADGAVPFWLPRAIEFPFQALFRVFTRVNAIVPFAALIKGWTRLTRSAWYRRLVAGRQARRTPPNGPPVASLAASPAASSRDSGTPGTRLSAEGFTRAFTAAGEIANDRYYRDSCVQVRICYGAYRQYWRHVDLLLGGMDTYYCLYFAKSHERMGTGRVPLHYFQMPVGEARDPHALELVAAEVRRFLARLERLTGTPVDLARAKARLAKVNALKRLAAFIFRRYFQRGFVPFHWVASLLLHGAYTDYLGDVDFFHARVQRLVAVLDKRYKDGTLRNYRQEGIPRVLVVGGPGFDPVVPRAFEGRGACFLYLDVFPNELQYQTIDLSGDLVPAYARYLLGKMNFRRGIEDLHDFWLRQAALLDVEGIVFTNVWGCHHVAPSFRLFKDRAQAELGIPVLGTNFKDFGEHVGQLSTRVEAFLDLLRD